MEAAVPAEEVALAEVEDQQTLAEAVAAGVALVEAADRAVLTEEVEAEVHVALSTETPAPSAVHPIVAGASTGAIVIAQETQILIAATITHQAAAEALPAIEELTGVLAEATTSTTHVTLTTSDGQTLGLVSAPLDCTTDLAVSVMETVLGQD